uniref:Uncharacterized protein n=1 Tax=Rhizophora mucronata TaxID=61149 RepID=A0A2P2JBD5_RHIMU
MAIERGERRTSLLSP